MSGWARGRVAAPAFLLSVLLNLGIVYGVGTALLRNPPLFERIEVAVREIAPLPPAQWRLPPQASRPPEAPVQVSLPRPAAVPQQLSLTRTEVSRAPQPHMAPAPLPVPAALPSSAGVPLRLARVGPAAGVPVPPEQASVSPAPPAPPSPPPAPTAARSDPGILKTYYAEVRAHIEAEKHYPRWARKARVEGRTTVAFHLGPSGALLEVTVRESSGHKVLDRAALAAVERAAPFPPFPSEAGKMPETLTVVVGFVLE